MLRSFAWTTLAALVGVTLCLPSAAMSQEVKGHLKIGVHDVKLEKDKLYKITVDSKSAQKPMVSLDFQQGFLTAIFESNQNYWYFTPRKSEKFTFYVTPGFGQQKEETIDYTLKFKGIDFDKPFVDDKYTFTDKDPTYQPPPGAFGPKDSYYKAYKVQLKAGKMVMIDMIHLTTPMDPFLFLEGPDGKIVAHDDDGGGNLNARIIYVPTKDGEYRVIATTLRLATGEFTLTARTAKD